MPEISLSAKAHELLAMAGREGKLHVPQFFDRCHEPCGPCAEERELLEKGYLIVGQRTEVFVEYRLTQRAQCYLAAQRRTLR